MKAKSLAVALALLAAMIVAAPALAQPASPGSGGQTVADVHRLSNQLRDVIRNVEKAGLPCVTQNTIVRRLRLVDDALLSGRRSAARALLEAWIGQARSMEGAGLLTAPQGAMLQVPLGNILPQIGAGSVKNPLPTTRWPPLPSCHAETGSGGLSAVSAVPTYQVFQPSDARVMLTETGTGGLGAVSAVSTSQIFQFSDVRLIVTGAVRVIPYVGSMLSGLIGLFWPKSEAPDVDSLISDTIRSQVSAALDGLKNGMQTFELYESAWQADCETYGVSSTQCSSGTARLASQWDSLNLDLQIWEPQFRLQGHEVELLPFYAQFMNLYLAFLREGALARNWPGGSNFGSIPESEIRVALNASDTSRFLGYVNHWYQQGLDQQPLPNNIFKWTTRNQYVRNMTLQVLDFRDMWPYLDPGAYPNGFPGFKLTRMIYSDPLGAPPCGGTFPLPDYADGPLQHVTVFTHDGGYWHLVKALQFTGGPTSGPAVTSPIMGAPVPDDSNQSDFDVRPGSSRGPIVTAEGWTKPPFEAAFCDRLVLASLDFTFANGSAVEFASRDFNGRELTVWNSFHYDDEVVARMSARGEFFGSEGQWADLIIFGFRYADSFYPSGQAINAGTGGCMTAPSTSGGVVDSPCTSTADKFWTYYSPFRELRAWAGAQCLTAPSTSAGTQLQTQSCNHGPSQQWTVSPGTGGGTITGVQSGLVVGSGGGQIQLQNKTGATTQKWKTFNKVQGPVHAVGAGKCLGVSSLSNGTPVQIYSCNGLTPTQTWVYSPSMQTLSLVGWTQCLTARGTTTGSLVEINACTGEASQQWREATGVIIHVQSGLFLDVLGGNTADGSPVGLWPLCLDRVGYFGDATCPHELWTWPMN